MQISNIEFGIELDKKWLKIKVLLKLNLWNV